MLNMTDKTWIKLMEIGRRTGCHQMPERSFFVGDRQFPVCSRCAGVIFGWLAAVISAFFWTLPIYAVPLLCLPMAVDWLLQKRGIIKNNNPRRFIVGGLCGYALMSLYITAVVLIFNLITK